ncbi:MAG TPA: hypothetical protein VGF48_23505 [Thermoanaerobaculia bacterium]|jgi:hypothetical protein
MFSLRAFVIATVALLLSFPAAGFDGEEHRLIARNGMKLVADFCRQAENSCNLTPEQQVQLAEFANPHSRLDYGTLVAAVDYRLNPLQLLQKHGPQQSLPAHASDLDPHLVELLTTGGTTFLRAAAANETHFQGDLVAGIRSWHAYAVSIAAGTRSVEYSAAAADTDVKGNLFAALLVNSIADHFLHDFFAPGHIITPRFGLHDAVALSIHNKYNTLGARFTITRDMYETDLQPLLKFLGSDALLHDRYKRAVAEIEDGRIDLWGDSQLKESPGQELFMILVQARSILDIIESMSGDPVNRFLRLHWQPMQRRRGKDDFIYDFATASLPYGNYVHHEHGGRQPEGGTVLSFSIGAELLLGVPSGASASDDKQTTARTAYLAEILVAGHLPTAADEHATDLARPVPVHFSEKRQWGLNAGYALAHNATETAHGPSVRGIWALPLLHMQFSADVSEKVYAYKEESRRRTSFGVRVQSGFSLVLFDLGVAREWTYGTRGVLKAETAIRFGGTLTGPLSGIPFIGKLEQRFYRNRRSRF